MRIRTVDTFTDRPFTGNPAGVMVLDADTFADDGLLQRIATELNLSETAFVRPLPPGGGADWALRWFTPAAEVDMCGHATLATAHVLHTTGAASGTMRFTARCGILTATAGPDGAITLDFPTAPLTPEPAPAGLAAVLGAQPLSVHDTGPYVGDLLVELSDEATVRGLRPDLVALAGLSRRGVIATAAAQDPALGHDFVSRGFFPRLGIDEDPVTGSAHTALAPFWSARLGRDELTGLQVSARSGLVRTSLRGGRTLLTGNAVTVIDGELLTAP
ncbi:PhzF family phenazine biosynthesis protein [Streptomyces sp. ML-6]|uniref:PhzF family phenazine biosynthesis protein n=1 Tax=unclassified Streptomyces TaxID=2593676 RepID=UPI0024C07670|nr:PhzF family phenazine biosynthesis protein [Streptomyces sp. ML-6]MDK0518274.1 PhzF family phenazine biosynthesis protein [Streptomyces sp. ML-6]